MCRCEGKDIHATKSHRYISQPYTEWGDTAKSLACKNIPVLSQLSVGGTGGCFLGSQLKHWQADPWLETVIPMEGTWAARLVDLGWFEKSLLRKQPRAQHLFQRILNILGGNQCRTRCGHKQQKGHAVECESRNKYKLDNAWSIYPSIHIETDKKLKWCAHKNRSISACIRF